jgi:hypothetical protein
MRCVLFFTTCVGAGWADPRAVRAARMFVLAGVLDTSVLLDDARTPSTACTGCWKHRKQVYHSMGLAEANNGVARSGSSQERFSALNLA